MEILHVHPDEPYVIQLRQVGTVALKEGDLPVWQAISDKFDHVPVVRFEDMPDDLARVFSKSQNGATQPFHGVAFLWDFGSFLGRDLKV